VNPLLEQFLSETRDFLQGIGEKLMQLEQSPGDTGIMVELFRLVHTLKGNSGLFDFPEMTRVLHAGEDLMDAVRDTRIPYSQALADSLLDAMDFVGELCNEIESTGSIDPSSTPAAMALANALRALTSAPSEKASETPPLEAAAAAQATETSASCDLSGTPEEILMEAYRQRAGGQPLHFLAYAPDEQCFFQGDDPFFTIRQVEETLWSHIAPREPWPAIAELDAYRCVLTFSILTSAPHADLVEHFRYVPDQVEIVPVEASWLVRPVGISDGDTIDEDFVSDALKLLDSGNVAALRLAAQTMLGLTNPDLKASSALRWLVLVLKMHPTDHATARKLLQTLGCEELTDKPAALNPPVEAHPKPLPSEFTEALKASIAAQRAIVLLNDNSAWAKGRLKAAAVVLANCCRAAGDAAGAERYERALEQCLREGTSQALLDAMLTDQNREPPAATSMARADIVESPLGTASVEAGEIVEAQDVLKSGRRGEDAIVAAKSIKVDQSKIDLLMNLIGEIVVAKNAMPYLAQRAEDEFGVRELSREIKAQHAVINRIAEEMQGAIMQVRMMPVSFVFQRFPRLVRDLSRKLNKEVQLLLEGEETEADKNIIEALADPLIHIVRNSLDHGIEAPEVRLASGKPAMGTLNIRASQEGDHVVIEIVDDGKGIDPAVIRRKAYEKGVIDEAGLERLSDREAVNLVFAAGFSTADTVSDLSGRGVGMDVVRTAVERVNGSIVLDSEVGKGTRIRIVLPLSMAITKVMIIESDGQTFGIPMEHVLETVRVPSQSIQTIKDKQVILLRGSVVPLAPLNTLLGMNVPPRQNDDGELAVLVTRIGGDAIGLIVDDFQESVDVIQKPLGGVLGTLSVYSGSALMGNGSVLMVLNVKEML
jgi:two-component system chemotaxis sensor kinase CheA